MTERNTTQMAKAMTSTVTVVKILIHPTFILVIGE